VRRPFPWPQDKLRQGPRKARKFPLKYPEKTPKIR